MGKLIIGTDVGTTASKILIVDENGEILAQEYHEYPLIFPGPQKVEQNIELIRDTYYSAIKKAISSLPTDRIDDVSAISMSTQRSTMVLLDKNGIPLRNAITWMDGRSGVECDEIRRIIGAEGVLHATGMSIGAVWSFAFICWLKKHEREVFDQAECFALVNTFLLHEMGTEEYVTDYSSACESMMFDPLNKCWSQIMLDYIQLDIKKLPKPVPSGQIVGYLREDLVQKFGLTHSIPLVTGGGDQQCAALGGGVVSEGDVSIGMGTAANILAVSSKCRFEKECNLITNLATLKDTWFLEGSLVVCGPILNWMKDLLYAREAEKMAQSEIYDILNREVLEKSKPGSNGVSMVPHYQGAGCPYWDSDATGVIEGLTLSTSRADLVRSVMEGMAMEINKSLLLLKENGINIKRMVLTGGAGKSPAWCQILADVFGVPVEIPMHPDVSAIGSAVLAACAIGVYSDPLEGTKPFAHPQKVYCPNQENHVFYAKLTEYNDKLYKGIRRARD